MSSGWERLNCPYFFEVASRALGDYFLGQGFTLNKTVGGGMMLTRWGVYVGISYVSETCPNYELTLVVGLGTNIYDERGGLTGVPAWYVIPNDSPAMREVLWRFNSENKLDTLLRHLQAEVLQPFMEPLWNRTEVLEELIERFKKDRPWDDPRKKRLP